jgi:undecaprenyl-diphosphatase
VPSLWEALVLGVVQGVAEWLPVSSSAHLALAERALGVETPVAFGLALHLGTLAAVAVALRDRIRAMLRALAAGRGDPRRAWRESPDFRLAVLLALATLPAAASGLLLEHTVEEAFGSQAALGLAFLWTAAVLATTRWARPRDGLAQLRPTQAAAIGLAQSLAILPGVSRSGMTIAAGVHAGLDRESAVELSFLLSIPTLLGAALLKAPELAALGSVGWGAVAAGVAAAFVAGTLSLGFLLGWVVRHGLLPFAAYDAAVGAALLATA